MRVLRVIVAADDVEDTSGAVSGPSQPLRVRGLGAVCSWNGVSTVETLGQGREGKASHEKEEDEDAGDEFDYIEEHISIGPGA